MRRPTAFGKKDNPYLTIARKPFMTEAPRPSEFDEERIRADQPAQLREWSNRFGVSPAELRRIVVEVGNNPDKVRAYLNNRF